MSTIKRIDTISECPNADPYYIDRYNAYLLDEHPVYFDIIDRDKAVVLNPVPELLAELIEEFRFFNHQITRYYDTDGKLLCSYQPVALTQTAIDTLQPSQFYISERKLSQCSAWIESKEQVVIPVYSDSNYVCDGHTRLYAALQKGITHCYTYPADGVDDYIRDFVRMAQQRGIHSVADMQLLSEPDYHRLWNQFCDDYFRTKK